VYSLIFPIKKKKMVNGSMALENILILFDISVILQCFINRCGHTVSNVITQDGYE
jgi:hypothetical protein